MKNIVLILIRTLPILVCLVFMFLYLFSKQDITAESLLNIAPKQPLFAALFLVLLYALKSLTIFFPVVILNILGGFLFSPTYAIIVNAAGVIVELTVPYLIGKTSGSGIAEKLRKKYPKLAELISNSGSDFFRAFFLRVISCLPGDAISMYFGAIKMPYLTCLTGSFLGTLPGMISATILGMNITNPSSPMFWMSIGLNVVISAMSFLFYFLWKKHKNKM